MSRLGIAFVLPYTGANGIKVVNNVISIDSTAIIEVNEIDASTLVAAQMNVQSLLVIGETLPYVEVTAKSIDMYDVSSTNILDIDQNGNISGKTIKTYQNNNSAPVISFDTTLPGNTPPVADSILQATFDGVGIDLPYTNGQ